MQVAAAFLTITFTLAASAGTSRADLDDDLAKRARESVAKLKPKEGTDVKQFTLLVTVQPNDLDSILTHGLINFRLVLRADAFYDAIRTRQFAGPVLGGREQMEIAHARQLGISEPAIMSLLAPDLFPKSAFIAIEHARCGGGYLAPGFDQTLRNYGKIQVQLRDVADRVTFTVGDSLDDSPPMQALGDLQERSFLRDERNGWGSFRRGNYIEGQVWGPISPNNIEAIWIPSGEVDSSLAKELTQLANARGVSVHEVEAKPTNGNECVHIRSTSAGDPKNRPTFEQRIAPLKDELAKVHTELSTLASQPSVNDNTWNDLLARRRRLVYFMARTGKPWSELAPSGNDVFVRQDKTVFDLYQRALRGEVPTSGTLSPDEIRTWFTPRGTGWKAFLNEVKLWCRVPGTASAVPTIVHELPAKPDDYTGLSVMDVVETYAACQPTVNTYVYASKLNALAQRAISVSPGTAITDLRDQILSVVGAIGTLKLDEFLFDTLRRDAEHAVCGKRDQLQNQLTEISREIERLETSRKDDCADFAHLDMTQIRRERDKYEQEFNAANRECNEYQTFLENKHSTYSAMPVKEFRSKFLKDLKAQHKRCQEREVWQTKLAAASRCLSNVAGRVRAESEKVEKAKALEELEREFGHPCR